MVKIELIYVAEDQTNLHVQLNLEQGATVRDALMAAQLWTLYPETKDLPVGIYAKRVTEDTLLKDG
ncbi:MAG: RnfH family protein, partial [bacterium]|nr:RnfH family protein [bacterium]